MDALKIIAIVSFLLFLPISYGQQPLLWSGGISEEERLQAPQEGTKLVFFVSAGNYLADIAVSITNEHDQQVVNTRTNGPWLIVRLPAGSYQLIAERNNGDIQSIRMELEESDNSEIGIVFSGN